MTSEHTHERTDPQESATGHALWAPWRAIARHESALWTVVVAAAIADIATTSYGLANGLTETNPVARTAFERFGFGSMVLLKGGSIGVGLACRPLVPDRHTAIVPLALAIPWVPAVLVNLVLIVVVA